jgi:hypothetical protein
VKQLFDRIEVFAENRWGPIEKTYIYENTNDFLYSIDENSQKIFPLIFLALQVSMLLNFFSSLLTTRPNKLECLHVAKTFLSSLAFNGSTWSLPRKEAGKNFPV